jgi:hypothetical protein
MAKERKLTKNLPRHEQYAKEQFKSGHGPLPITNRVVKDSLQGVIPADSVFFKLKNPISIMANNDLLCRSLYEVEKVDQDKNEAM